MWEDSQVAKWEGVCVSEMLTVPGRGTSPPEEQDALATHTLLLLCPVSPATKAIMGPSSGQRL